MAAVDNVLLFQRIYARLQEHNPKVRVVAKHSLRIHQFINFVMNLVVPKSRKDSYNRYHTSFWRRIGMANQGDDPKKFGNWRVLCHEWDHMDQEDRNTRVGFSLAYLWPISQGIVLALLCWLPVFWANGWYLAIWIPAWFIVGGLHLIPQLPDPWRERWELHAYSISMHLFHLVHGDITQEYIDHVITQFHSMAYYIMSPSEKRIRAKLMRVAADIKAGNSPVKDSFIVKTAEEEYLRMRVAV